MDLENFRIGQRDLVKLVFIGRKPAVGYHCLVRFTVSESIIIESRYFLFGRYTNHHFAQGHLFVLGIVSFGCHQEIGVL